MEKCFSCGARAELLIPCKYMKSFGYDDMHICPDCFVVQYLTRRVRA